MAFNGSGTFLVNTSGQPVVPNTVISATTFNALTNDLANGLSTCITKDGQTTPTANIPMGNNKITGLAPGTSGTDAANLSQVQGSTAKLLQSVTGTDTITAAMVPALTAYAAGQMFYFVAAGDNTGAVTINIDSLGAKSVTRDGSTALVAGDITNGKVVVIVYDGTRFQLLNSNAFTNLYVSGNLGVGNNTPAYKFHVERPSYGITGYFYANDGTRNPRLVVYGSSSGTTIQHTFSTGADSLIFAVGGAIGTGTEVARFVDGGNLGIGTASPSSRLDVRGQETTNYNTVVFGNGTDNQFFNFLCGRALTNGTSAGVASSLVMTLRSSGSVAGVLAFATGNDECGRFDQNGNLGIGTASPESKLDVRNGYITGGTDSAVNGSKLLANYYTAGALSTWGAEFSTGAPMMGYAVWPSPLSANSFVSSTALSNLTRGAYTIEGAAHKWFIGGSQTVAVDGAVTMSRAMTLDAAGYLGIGTTSPGSRLHVDAPTNTVQIRAGDGNVLTYAAYSSGVSTNALNYYGTASNHDLGFLTNNAERARITKTGNIVAGASVALATTATDGFLYVPTCAGTPTGTPTAITGMAPIVVNTTNNKLYFYSGGAWRDAGP
jgi:hypothetical protein